MLSFALVAAPAIILVLALRWAFFARLRFYHTPFCPACRESRGRILGVGEETNHPYFRCPHCGHVYDGDDAEAS